LFYEEKKKWYVLFSIEPTKKPRVKKKYIKNRPQVGAEADRGQVKKNI
jgi:hypothetical protein